MDYDYILDKVSTITIAKFDDTKILIDTDDKFLDDITFKNVVIIMTCTINYGNKFSPQLFLEEGLLEA